MTAGHEQITVADSLLLELARFGVDTIFGIISIHNLPFYDALQRSGKFRVITGRHEGAVVNMADAYARASGRLGVALTSTGTGAGNAAGSLMESINGGAPLLHITGNVAQPYVDTDRGYIHDIKDQLRMLQAVSKSAYRVRHGQQAPGIFRKAIVEALAAPKGPVSVEIPIDLQAALISVPDIRMPEFTPQGPTDAELEAVVEECCAARRTVIWAGGGVVQSDASSALTELARLLDAAVIFSQSGRGSFPESDPRCIGHFATFPAVHDFLAKADLLISVAIRFRGNETSNWKARTPARHICIDVDPAAVSRNFTQSTGLIGDAGVILSSLVRLAGKRNPAPKPEYVREVHNLQSMLRGQLRGNIGPWVEILDVMNEVIPRDAILVRDVTVQATIWGSRLLTRDLPRTAQHASGGGIGQCLPMLIGAQCAKPDKAVVGLVGDGGFLLNAGSLATLVEERLPIVIVLFDDAAYGVLKNIQSVMFDGKFIGVDLASPDFVALASSFGMQAVRVADARNLRKSLAQAIGDRKPAMVVVDSNAIGPHAKVFAGPDGGAELYKPHS